MPELPFAGIKPSYQSLLDSNDFTAYATALCADGPSWWFEMDTPALLVHLLPLQNIAETMPVEAAPPRLQLLSLAINPATPPAALEQIYTQLVALQDYEAAAVCAGAGVANIWDSGAGFKRYQKWYARLGDLLAGGHGISPLGRASMHGFRGLVEMTGFGLPEQAEESYRHLSRLAEEAGSSSLRLFFAAAAAYTLLWQGRLSEAQMLVDDVAPLCALPTTSGVCNIYYQTTLGLVRAICGKPLEGKAVLESLVSMPFFSELPPPVFYLGYGHLLHAMAHSSSEEEIDSVAAIIRQRAVPEQNHFHHSYLHFNLGVAYLGVQAASKALVHSEEAIRRGNLSDSPIAENMPSFLRGQALADLGRTDAAREHFLAWLEKWAASGYQILAAAGAVELANMAVKRGAIEEGRKYYDRAQLYMPPGENLCCLFRDDKFPAALSGALFPCGGADILAAEEEEVPVRIGTFGPLVVNIKGRTVYDRDWRGKGSRRLLTALIVLGGSKVEAEKICDLLWPDYDGDKAYSNLKVALSRLRRVACQGDEKPLPWLVMKQKKISLVKSLCRVDSLVFQDAICRALRSDDPVPFWRLAEDIYRDDFLANDRSEVWIDNHSELLRCQYISAVTADARLCLDKDDSNPPLQALSTALTRDPLNEEIYALLMEANLQLGYPARALQVFRQAEEIFRTELGILPGPVLRQLARRAGGGSED